MEVARLVWSLAIALGIAGGGYRKRSLDKSGAVAALVVGTLTLYASARAGALLISFFVTSSLVTRLGARTKKRLEADFKEGGGRDWHQVLSNSPATVLCVLMLLRGGETETLFHGYLAQLAAMQGDTWSSELGVLATRLPRLVTTGRPVPTGTNGGMTPEGTMAAVVGGAVLVVPLMVLLGSPATLLVWAARCVQCQQSNPLSRSHASAAMRWWGQWWTRSWAPPCNTPDWTQPTAWCRHPAATSSTSAAGHCWTITK